MLTKFRDPQRLAALKHVNKVVDFNALLIAAVRQREVSRVNELERWLVHANEQWEKKQEHKIQQRNDSLMLTSTSPSVVEERMVLYEEARNRSLRAPCPMRPNEKTFQLLMISRLQTGDWAAALDYFIDIQTESLPVTDTTLQIVFRAFEQSRATDTWAMALKTFRSYQHRVTSSTIAEKLLNQLKMAQKHDMITKTFDAARHTLSFEREAIETVSFAAVATNNWQLALSLIAENSGDQQQHHEDIKGLLTPPLLLRNAFTVLLHSNKHAHVMHLAQSVSAKRLFQHTDNVVAVASTSMLVGGHLNSFSSAIARWSTHSDKPLPWLLFDAAFQNLQRRTTISSVGSDIGALSACLREADVLLATLHQLTPHQDENRVYHHIKQAIPSEIVNVFGQLRQHTPCSLLLCVVRAPSFNIALQFVMAQLPQLQVQTKKLKTARPSAVTFAVIDVVCRRAYEEEKMRQEHGFAVLRLLQAAIERQILSPLLAQEILARNSVGRDGNVSSEHVASTELTQWRTPFEESLQQALLHLTEITQAVNEKALDSAVNELCRVIPLMYATAAASITHEALRRVTSKGSCGTLRALLPLCAIGQSHLDSSCHELFDCIQCSTDTVSLVALLNLSVSPSFWLQACVERLLQLRHEWMWETFDLLSERQLCDALLVRVVESTLSNVLLSDSAATTQRITKLRSLVAMHTQPLAVPLLKQLIAFRAAPKQPPLQSSLLQRKREVTSLEQSLLQLRQSWLQSISIVDVDIVEALRQYQQHGLVNASTLLSLLSRVVFDKHQTRSQFLSLWLKAARPLPAVVMMQHLQLIREVIHDTALVELLVEAAAVECVKTRETCCCMLVCVSLEAQGEDCEDVIAKAAKTFLRHPLAKSFANRLIELVESQGELSTAHELMVFMDAVHGANVCWIIEKMLSTSSLTRLIVTDVSLCEQMMYRLLLAGGARSASDTLRQHEISLCARLFVLHPQALLQMRLTDCDPAVLRRLVLVGEELKRQCNRSSVLKLFDTFQTQLFTRDISDLIAQLESDVTREFSAEEHVPLIRQCEALCEDYRRNAMFHEAILERLIRCCVALGLWRECVHLLVDATVGKYTVACTLMRNVVLVIAASVRCREDPLRDSHFVALLKGPVVEQFWKELALHGQPMEVLASCRSALAASCTQWNLQRPKPFSKFRADVNPVGIVVSEFVRLTGCSENRLPVWVTESVNRQRQSVVVPSTGTDTVATLRALLATKSVEQVHHHVFASIPAHSPTHFPLELSQFVVESSETPQRAISFFRRSCLTVRSPTAVQQYLMFLVLERIRTSSPLWNGVSVNWETAISLFSDATKERPRNQLVISQRHFTEVIRHCVDHEPSLLQLVELFTQQTTYTRIEGIHVMLSLLRCARHSRSSATSILKAITLFEQYLPQLHQRNREVFLSTLARFPRSRLADPEVTQVFKRLVGAETLSDVEKVLIESLL